MKHDDVVEIVADLKQFISATVSQQLSLQTQALRDDIKKDTKESVDELRQEMNQRFAEQDQRFTEQDEKLDEIMNAVGGELQDHDSRIADNTLRIRQLEKKVA